MKDQERSGGKQVSRKDNAGLYFKLSCAGFVLMSALVLLMPVQSFSESRAATVVIGLCFWAFMAAGLLFAALAAKTVQARMRALGRQKEWDRKRIGLLSLGANLPGLVSDGVFVLSLLLFIILSFTRFKFAYINYVLIGLTMLGLAFHCLFNGRTFYFIDTKTEDKRRMRHHEKN